MSLVLAPSDWLALLLHFVALSLLAVGGAITTAPDMHRYLVGERLWLSDAQFSASVALAQASPGPNVLFVALLGWNVGLNAGGYALASAGMVLTLVGTLLPSATLTYLVGSWAHRRRELRVVRAFKQGMAPIVIALLLSTAWLLSAAHAGTPHAWPLWLLTALCTLLVWRTNIHLLWLLTAGALLGAFGWV